MKANDNVLLEEYAYFGKLLEDIENPMIKIIDGIIEYLRTGEYKDLVGIDGAKQISPESEGLYNKLKEQYLKLLKNTDMKEVFTYSVHNLSTDGEGWLNSETQKEYYDLKTAISAAKKELAKYKNVEDEVVVTIFGGEYEDENGNIEGEPRIFQQFSNKDKKFDSIINNSKNFMTMDKIKDSFSATDISDEVAAYFDFLEELANEWEYGLDISNNREGEWALEFAKYTSAGQDFSAIILIDKDTNADYVNDEVLKELGDYTEYFDAHEQADLWSEVVDYDEDGNEIREGRNGAPADYNDIVADMEEARNDLYDFYLDLRRESEKFIENNATDWILNKLDKVKGVFYTISKSELNTSYEDEYEPFDTLGGAVTNAMEGLSEGKRWVVVDENGVVMFDCNDSTSRERFAMEGGYEEWANIILNFLTHEAENLIE